MNKLIWIATLALALIVGVIAGASSDQTAVLVFVSATAWSALFFLPLEKEYYFPIICLVSAILMMLFVLCYLGIVVFSSEAYFSWKELVASAVYPLLVWQYFLLPIALHAGSENQKATTT